MTLILQKSKVRSGKRRGFTNYVLHGQALQRAHSRETAVGILIQEVPGYLTCTANFCRSRQFPLLSKKQKLPQRCLYRKNTRHLEEWL
ncbi:hypothetical protein PoB_005727200 [Plakobranchus ocellatus]|uniref:Uncharacterized protein n=1 Tax=Plakobranchus ocellatus TaxID=259542 RepID=A0AAV4CHJ1_9GAST|nr:hypothetical protein PoB_005727200 [Plakobranchus ocellatus]